MSQWYKGQLVCYRCLNPAVGKVTRSSDDHGWVEVKWLESKRASRYDKKDILPINGMLNYWIQKDLGIGFSNASIPSSDLEWVLSKEV